MCAKNCQNFIRDRNKELSSNYLICKQLNVTQYLFSARVPVNDGNLSHCNGDPLAEQCY